MNTIFIFLNHEFIHVDNVLHLKLEMSVILSLRGDNESSGVTFRP